MKSPADQLLRVVRGEADWPSLKPLGFGIERETVEGGVAWKFAAQMPASVDPAIEDFAAAVLQLRGNPERLRDWARFILASNDLVSFDALENRPDRDEFIGALWDFSGHGDRAAMATLVRIAESIRTEAG
ncbi:MAG: hypothetical protein AB7F08_01255 [Dongiaceae bacterium]